MSGGIVGVGAPDPGTSALINRLMNPPNPLEQAGQTINALTGIRNYQAQQASADAYRQSVNPLTGEVDLGRYKALLSQGPGAFNFGPLVTSGGQAVGAVGQGTSADVKSKLDQINVQQAYMSPLMARIAQGQPVTGQDVLDAAANMPPGIITPQMQTNLRAQVEGLPGGASGDASGIVRGGYFASEAGRDMLHAQMPNLGTISSGSVLYPVQTNPVAPGGLQYPKAPLPLTMTPGQSGTPVDVPLPGGNTAKMPAGVFAAGPDVQRLWLQQNYPQIYGSPPAGAPPSAAPGPAGAGAPTPAPTAEPTGRPPPAPAAAGGSGTGAPAAPTTAAPAVLPAPGGGGGSSARPAPAAAPPTSPSTENIPLWAQPPPPPRPGPGAGDVGVTPSPGYVQAQTATATASTAAANTLQGQVAATRDTLPLLDDMQAKLASGQLVTGAGIDTVNHLRQLMIRFGLAPATPGAGFNAADPAAIQDEFAKDAALLQAAQLKALGNPSDSRQELALESNPGKLLSTQGNQGIIEMLKGNQYALRAQGDAWGKAQQLGWDPSRFNEWQNERFLANDSQTGGRFDPQTFWLAAKSPADQRKFAGQMTQSQLTQFAKNAAYAQKMGWITKNSDGTFSIANQ